MKKFYTILVAFAMLCVTSCTKSGLLNQIPADADIVVVGNLKTIAESAGGSLSGSEIKIPDYIGDELSRRSAEKLDEFKENLESSGINAEEAAIILDLGNKYPGEPVFVVAVDDKKKFAEFIAYKGFSARSSDGDVEFYVKEDSYWESYEFLAFDGKYCYYIDEVWDEDFNGVAYLRKVIERAHDKSLAKTSCGDYIAGGNALGFILNLSNAEMQREVRRSALPAMFAEGFLCMRGNLKGNRASLEMKMFDAQGKERKFDFMKEYMDISATINKNALAFLGEDEFMVHATSMKDVKWDKLADVVLADLSRSERMQANLVLSYLENIDGTIAYGFGFTNGFESIAAMEYGADMLKNISCTAVVETKDGKAKRLLEDMKGLMEESGIPFADTANGFSIDLSAVSREEGAIYVECVDNFLVASTRPVMKRSNPVVKQINAGKYMTLIAAVQNRNDKIMSDLGIDNDVQIMFTADPGTLDMRVEFEVDGNGSDGVIARVAKAIINFAKHADDVYERYYSGRYNYYYDDDDDEDFEYYIDEAVEMIDEALW